MPDLVLQHFHTQNRPTVDLLERQVILAEQRHFVDHMQKTHVFVMGHLMQWTDVIALRHPMQWTGVVVLGHPMQWIYIFAFGVMCCVSDVVDSCLRFGAPHAVD